MRDVIETLAEGKSILYKATMPEGLTSEQIVERLKAEPNLSGDISSVPAEGTLLPDTYYFSKGASRKEILDRMQAGDAEGARRALGRSRRRSAVALDRGTGDVRVDRRKGNRPSG